MVAVTATALAAVAADARKIPALISLPTTSYHQATSMVTKTLGISMLVVLPLSSVSPRAVKPMFRLGTAKVKATGVVPSARRYILLYIGRTLGVLTVLCICYDPMGFVSCLVLIPESDFCIAIIAGAKVVMRRSRCHVIYI